MRLVFWLQELGVDSGLLPLEPKRICWDWNLQPQSGLWGPIRWAHQGFPSAPFGSRDLLQSREWRSAQQAPRPGGGRYGSLDWSRLPILLAEGAESRPPPSGCTVGPPGQLSTAERNWRGSEAATLHKRVGGSLPPEASGEEKMYKEKRPEGTGAKGKETKQERKQKEGGGQGRWEPA